MTEVTLVIALRSLLQPILAFVAIMLAAIAQYLHVYRQANLAAGLLLIVALCFGSIAIVTRNVDVETRLTNSTTMHPQTRRTTRGLVVSTAVLALLTFLFSSGNQFTVDNLMAWLLSIAVFLYTFWEPQKNGQEWRMWLTSRATSAREAFAAGIRMSPRALMLAGIFLVGVFFYFHNLDGVPAEMDSDHAEKLLDVNDVVNEGLAPIFFERNTGREPLQFYLTAAFIQITGHPIDYMALKLITATMGVLVIPGAFLFARELFADDVALLTAALIAISKWPITIARMGLRFPFTPVFVAPLMFFLFRAFKYQRRNDFLMAGLFLGAGLYGYNAFRIAPLLVVAFVVIWLVIQRKMDGAQLRRYIDNSALMFLFALVVLMPLLRYAVERPDQVAYRMLTRLFGEFQPIPGNPVEILAANLVNVSGMFNWTGDMAWPNSVIGDPALDYISGSLFLLGLVYALYRVVRYRESAHAFVLIGLATMLLPSAFSIAFPNENPSIVRAGGAIPFVFILAALPMGWLAHAIRSSSSDSVLKQLGAATVIAGLLIVSARANYLRYFRDFDASYRQHSWNSSDVASVIHDFAGSVGDIDHAWILMYPHWVDTRNVAINLRQIDWEHTLASGEDARPHTKDSANKLYILNLNDSTNLELLQRIFPNGQQRLFHAQTPGHDFVVFYVPGTIAPNEPLGVR